MTQPPYSPPPPPYGAPYGPGPYPYPAPPQTNGMAIASLVCAFVFAPLGIVFGHISLSQIKRTGEEGRGLAMAGLVISYLVTALTIVALVLGVALFSWMARVLREEAARNDGAGIPSSPRVPGGDRLPAFNPPAGLGANCTYPATITPADKPAKPPRTGKVPTAPATVNATMTTNDGAIGLQLDNARAPCTVNSFVSLAQQGYFDNTPCHRLTASAALAVLQCGDPTGTGRGGPGYRFANEYPTNQYRPFDPALQQAVRYPRGSLAMANAGPDSNGSQFFIVYRDSMLPPTYTVFGTVDSTGLATVDNIAEAGITGDPDDEKPKKAVTVTSVRLD
ncbi:peptidylprolyl isomerase [Candidatus Mycolicibacterium alkanivorans]|uniref:Peptidylprolyl isomerase n=1 Tax=Candidatus Mycolicibacterium alkanivorans TaxID=2954114 RepID=A0ABS9YY66_9MYCO|nr:peptidylprolyl isomerase [Candidatus Mycolicibacterium alkanivorans]MCI4676195.1 peptidylprolyl isomerase [Candidatus Mycolicibacterium alkanivorans]